MAYNFFSKQLLESNLLNLSDVFPEMQNEAKSAIAVSYGLSDIVLYIQDVTQNFKKSEPRFIDLDNAVQSIVDKYYNSKGEKNPFTINYIGLKPTQGEVPREAAIVGDGKMKGKGVAKAPKIGQEQEQEETIVVQSEPQQIIPDDVPQFIKDDELDVLDASIQAVEENLLEGEELESTMTFISNQTLYSGVFDTEKEGKDWFKQKGYNYKKYIN